MTDGSDEMSVVNPHVVNVANDENDESYRRAEDRLTSHLRLEHGGYLAGISGAGSGADLLH